MKSPLENVFNIEEDTTESIFSVFNPPMTELPIEVVNSVTGEALELSPDLSIEDENRAEKIEDIQLQGQYDVIYKNALDAFQAQLDLAQGSDPRFAARNAEVAAQYLNIALNSTKDRTEAKFKRAKIKLAQQQAKPSTTNIQNNLGVIVADRNEILKMLKASEKEVSNV
jgi:hypothetical protein